ncbi:hypothetical protein HY024_02905 [Candidatus Curtissbacteria bacterium]|nr:hypothetical protein [Candidatus Curtissbacteria bacterium]
MLIEQALSVTMSRARTTQPEGIDMVIWSKTDTGAAIAGLLGESGAVDLLKEFALTLQQIGRPDARTQAVPASHAHALLWDEMFSYDRRAPFTISAAILVTAVPHTREVLVIGQVTERLQEEQWREKPILADALVRAHDYAMILRFNSGNPAVAIEP